MHTTRASCLVPGNDGHERCAVDWGLFGRMTQTVTAAARKTETNKANSCHCCCCRATHDTCYRKMRHNSRHAHPSHPPSHPYLPLPELFEYGPEGLDLPVLQLRPVQLCDFIGVLRSEQINKNIFPVLQNKHKLGFDYALYLPARVRALSMGRHEALCAVGGGAMLFPLKTKDPDCSLLIAAELSY